MTLDDLWALDLQKLQGWRCVKENAAGEDAFADEAGWETDSAGDGQETAAAGAAGGRGMEGGRGVEDAEHEEEKGEEDSSEDEE